MTPKQRETRQHVLGATLAAGLLLIFTFASGCGGFAALLDGAYAHASWLALAAAAGGLAMAAEATYSNSECDRKIVLTAAVVSGQVVQMPDGKAGVAQGLSGANFAIGDTCSFRIKGEATIAMASGVVMVDGQEVYWDHSANVGTIKRSGDKDFYVGTLRGDKATGTVSCKVRLNDKPSYTIKLQESGFDHVPVLTAGTPILAMVGGTARAAFSATAEAQKLDLLSKQSWAAGTPGVLHAVVEISTTADADVADLSIFIANGTHASDADSITESCGFHYDLGADLNIDCESEDGTTTVAAQDSTVDAVAGTPNHLLIDFRDEANVKMYIDGVRVVSGSTFDISDAAGPLKALFHLEKSSNDTLCVVELHELGVRLMEQVTN